MTKRVKQNNRNKAILGTILALGSAGLNIYNAYKQNKIQQEQQYLANKRANEEYAMQQQLADMQAYNDRNYIDEKQRGFLIPTQSRNQLKMGGRRRCINGGSKANMYLKYL